MSSPSQIESVPCVFEVLDVRNVVNAFLDRCLFAEDHKDLENTNTSSRHYVKIITQRTMELAP